MHNHLVEPEVEGRKVTSQFGLVVKYLGVDGLFLFSSLRKFVYFLWQEPWRVLDVVFCVASIML
jgi:hypothetical protein